MPAGLVNDVGEAIDFAESLGLAILARTMRPDGTEHVGISSPILRGGSPADARRAPPLLGEHPDADWSAEPAPHDTPRKDP